MRRLSEPTICKPAGSLDCTIRMFLDNVKHAQVGIYHTSQKFPMYGIEPYNPFK